jgi:hypothetical protein
MIVLKILNSISLLFLLLLHRWEEHVSYSWNCGLEAEINSVIDCLWANNSSFLGEKFHTTEASLVLIFLNRLEILGCINDNLAWNIVRVLTLESNNFVHNQFPVLLNGFVLNRLNEFLIIFSASNKNLTFHKLD